MEDIVIDEVKKIRETAPGIGSSTLYPLLLNIFGADNMTGRDHLYRLMKERGCSQSVAGATAPPTPIITIISGRT